MNTFQSQSAQDKRPIGAEDPARVPNAGRVSNSTNIRLQYRTVQWRLSGQLQCWRSGESPPFRSSVMRVVLRIGGTLAECRMLAESGARSVHDPGKHPQIYSPNPLQLSHDADIGTSLETFLVFQDPARVRDSGRAPLCLNP